MDGIVQHQTGASIRGFLGAVPKLRKVIISFIYLSVRLSAWNTSAPTGWIFMKFDIWVFFFNIRRGNSSLIEIRQETDIHSKSYIAHFFLEWEMFRTKVVENIETYLIHKNVFF